MFNLKQQVKEYLDLPEEHIDILFKRYKRSDIHRSLAACEKYFLDTGTTKERIQHFKKQLIN